MKGQRFGLDAVLRVRRRQEEAARNALMQANRQVALARRSVEDATDHLLAAPQGLGEADLDTFRVEWARATLAAEALSVRHRALGAADSAAARQRQVWSQAASAVAVLERLEERRRLAHQAELERAERLALDDLTAGRAARTGPRG